MCVCPSRLRCEKPTLVLWRQAAIALGILSLVVLYMLVFLLPLNWIAKKVRVRKSVCPVGGVAL